MSIIDELTVNDFKAQFPRNFPYLPLYDETQTYALGAEVYLEPTFYQSLIANNTSPLDDTEAWEVVEDSVDNYVTNNDIERAWQEALSNFNYGLTMGDKNAQLVFLYLVAFYLAYDLQLANGGAFGGINFPATSVTVGSVSESYYVPKMYLEDPILGFYARNGFGLKYLNLIYPRLIGNVGVVGGWSLP